MRYFPEPYNQSKYKIKVELYLPNYAIKSNLKNATGMIHQILSKRHWFASLKKAVDELDIDKLKDVWNCLNSLKSKVDKLDLVDLKRLNDIVHNVVFR